MEAGLQESDRSKYGEGQAKDEEKGKGRQKSEETNCVGMHRYPETQKC